MCQAIFIPLLATSIHELECALELEEPSADPFEEEKVVALLCHHFPPALRPNTLYIVKAITDDALFASRQN